jgi:hypothetical protein
MRLGACRMTSALWAVDLSDVVLAAFLGALVVGWIVLLVLMLVDLFRDPTIGTLAKVLWITLMVLVPFIGIFAYLLVRGDTVGRRIGATRAARSNDASEPEAS